MYKRLWALGCKEHFAKISKLITSIIILNTTHFVLIKVGKWEKVNNSYNKIENY